MRLSQTPCRYFSRYKGIRKPKCNCRPCHDKYKAVRAELKAAKKNTKIQADRYERLERLLVSIRESYQQPRTLSPGLVLSNLDNGSFYASIAAYDDEKQKVIKRRANDSTIKGAVDALILDWAEDTRVTREFLAS